MRKELPINSILVDELLGAKVRHLNPSLGRGVVVNAVFNEYQDSTGEILIDIEFALEKIRTDLNLLDYLTDEIITFYDSEINVSSVKDLIEDLLRWLNSGRREREEELEALKKESEKVPSPEIQDELRDEAYNYLVYDRGVERLIHFTALENLPSIINSGIIPRSDVPDGAVCLDEERRDGLRDWNCLSVTLPNWSMFYRFRMKDKRRIFAVLSLSPELMKSKGYDELLYMHTNAAASRYDGLRERHKGLKYAESIFSDKCFGDANTSYRESVGLSRNVPTDAQAEILVKGTIDSSFINRIYFETEEALEIATGMLPDQVKDLLAVDEQLYRQRSDWRLSKRY